MQILEKNRRFFDLEEVRQKVFDGKISKSYMYILVKSGRIKVIRIGRKILVPAYVIDDLIEKGLN